MSTDSVIMLRRNFKHTFRNPTAVFNAVLFPIVLLLMFVYVIGRAFDVGVDYVDYATPGMIVLAICYGLSATALAVNSDMTKGIINRFKVMDISRSAVLNAHVAASMLRSLIAIAAIIGVAFALGFRSAASSLEWLGAIGLIVVVSFATSWLTVAGIGREDPGIGGYGHRSADPAAVPEQRDRARGQDGARSTAVRGVSALHADHRNPARAADRSAISRRRDRRPRLVRRDRPRRIPVGAGHVQEARVTSRRWPSDGRVRLTVKQRA
jgi:ABC-2 type transporter